MPSLLEIWIEQEEFFDSKSIEQVIAICGDGNLRDGTEASIQLRELLCNIPTGKIEKYVGECLTNSFKQSGFVLQDLTNEIGRRLGFEIESGVYRGGGNRIGFDGIWTAKDGHKLVVEVKTTDAYLIDLDVQAKYRNKLIEEGNISDEKSSILMVVGRNDTGGLEAQTRGSKHAWDIRIVSVEALLRMLRIKENLSESSTLSQIQEILRPFEYTRIDRLVEIIFRTSEDLQADDVEEEIEESENKADGGAKTVPAKFHEGCVERVSKHLKIPLIRQGRCTYSNADDSIRALCIVSKDYTRRMVVGVIRYWFAFHPSQQEFLNGSKESFIALGCGSPNQTIVMPIQELEKHLPVMRTTESTSRKYWHIEVFSKDENFFLTEVLMKGLIFLNTACLQMTKL